MTVFVSWGDSRGRALARALHDWLSSVAPAVEILISPDARPASVAWRELLVPRLAACDYAILCRVGQAPPIALYEAGMCAQALPGRVIGYALHPCGEDPRIGTWLPWLEANPEGSRALLQALARCGSEIAPDRFDVGWPALAAELERVRGLPAADEVAQDLRGMLAELLELARPDHPSRASAPAPLPDFTIPAAEDGAPWSPIAAAALDFSFGGWTSDRPAAHHAGERASPPDLGHPGAVVLQEPEEELPPITRGELTTRLADLGRQLRTELAVSEIPGEIEALLGSLAADRAEDIGTQIGPAYRGLLASGREIPAPINQVFDDLRRALRQAGFPSSAGTKSRTRT